MIIAVDGPAGAGKGTICQKVAEQIGLVNFCSGEIYRLCALLTINQYGLPISQSHPFELIPFIQKNIIRYTWNLKEKVAEIWIGEENIRPLLHENHISDLASQVASKYTEEIVELVRIIGNQIMTDMICEGRNVGSFIFPDAKYKFYIDADPLIRAKRRYETLMKNEKIANLNLDTILQEIIARDERDKTRKHSPLVQLDEAIVINTSYQTIDESVNQMISYLTL
jgi:CMP/dCMP kinase